VTETVCPATVTVADRELVVPLAATVNATVPPPLPLAGDTVTQDALDDAVHAQPEFTVTVTEVVPPPAPIDAVVGVTP
jgi:hypothetical protein